MSRLFVESFAVPISCAAVFAPSAVSPLKLNLHRHGKLPTSTCYTVGTGRYSGHAQEACCPMLNLHGSYDFGTGKWLRNSVSTSGQGATENRSSTLSAQYGGVCLATVSRAAQCARGGGRHSGTSGPLVKFLTVSQETCVHLSGDA